MLCDNHNFFCFCVCFFVFTKWQHILFCVCVCLCLWVELIDNTKGNVSIIIEINNDERTVNHFVLIIGYYFLNNKYNLIVRDPYTHSMYIQCDFLNLNIDSNVWLFSNDKFIFNNQSYINNNNNSNHGNQTNENQNKESQSLIIKIIIAVSIVIVAVILSFIVYCWFLTNKKKRNIQRLNNTDFIDNAGLISDFNNQTSNEM